MDEDIRRRRAARLEAALWIVMGALAFLAKDNPDLVYPQSLYCFLLLLASSLGTSLSVRRFPRAPVLHALGLTLGFGAIAGLQHWSGGPASILWALYLLPIFSAAILLDGRALAWTAAGACVCDAALYAAAPGPWNAATPFELGLKTGVLAGAAGAAWLLSRAEREADERARRQRAVIERLERTARADELARENERELAVIAAGGAGAAHDLATPLMVVRGYARLHLDRGVSDPQLERDLKRIDEAAAFCQSLAAGLLRRGAGGTASERLLSSAVESALALAEPILRSRRVAVERDYPGRPSACARSRRPSSASR
jgi:signal transduction histidine kinase